MTEIEKQIFRLEGDIYVQEMHLKHQQTPSKYDLPGLSKNREQYIARTKARIAEKQIEIQKLKQLQK